MKKLMVGVFGMMSAMATAASFSYQGVLRSATGTAVENKNQSITFRLYDNPSSEQALWGRTCSVLLDENGLFNIELSDVAGSEVANLTNSLDQVIAANATGTLYIGLEVQGSSGEIRPRQKVLSVPLATFAQDVSLARNDFTVTGAATIKGKLTAMGEAEVKGLATVNKLSVKDGGTLAGDVNMTGKLNLSSGKLEMPAQSTFTIGGVSAVIPSGVIVMWNGSTANIPAGWVLCDGKNGTPNLTDRFIVGAGNEYAPGATGGEKEVTLTVSQIPAHDHEFPGDDELATRMNWGHGAGGRDIGAYGDYDAQSHGGNSRKYATSTTGEGKSHENRPPYYALCFIMKK